MTKRRYITEEGMDKRQQPNWDVHPTSTELTRHPTNQTHQPVVQGVRIPTSISARLTPSFQQFAPTGFKHEKLAAYLFIHNITAPKVLSFQPSSSSSCSSFALVHLGRWIHLAMNTPLPERKLKSSMLTSSGLVLVTGVIISGLYLRTKAFLSSSCRSFGRKILNICLG